MGQSLREDLLGYLLGALEPEDHRRVDRALSENEQLRDELTALRQQMVPLAHLDELARKEATQPAEAFPAGLARRTCEWVARQSRSEQPSRSERASHAAPLATLESSLDEDGRVTVAARATLDRRTTEGRRMTDVSRQRKFGVGAWTLADYVVASTVAILVMGMIAPALLASRNQSRLLACQNNLRRVGTGLYNYAENHEDRFIGLKQNGPLNVAGSYAPVLLENGYVDSQNLFFCSAATNEGLHDSLEIPTLDSLNRAYRENNERLAELQAIMGGSYGYTLGYWEDGSYVCPVNLGRSFRVIMADAPNYGLENNASANHGGTGQNLLFEDGSIQFARKASIGFPADSIFENRNGLIAAGTDVNDSVIGSSNASAWISPSFYEMQ